MKEFFNKLAVGVRVIILVVITARCFQINPGVGFTILVLFLVAISLGKELGEWIQKQKHVQDQNEDNYPDDMAS